MNKNTLIIVRGAPGRGKSFFYHKMFPNILHLENDMYHYHGNEYEYDVKKQKDAINWCITIADISLRKNMDVLISNTFTKKVYIDNYKRLADLLKCDFKVYRMMGDFKNIHGLSEEMVNRFENSMEDYEGEIFVYPNKENNGYDFLTEKR